MNIDFQTVLNLAGGLAMAVSGWFARELWSVQ